MKNLEIFLRINLYFYFIYNLLFILMKTNSLLQKKRKNLNVISKTSNLLTRAKELYEKESKKYDAEYSSFKWLNKIIEKGTFEDKIIALRDHIKINSNFTLKYLDLISHHLDIKNIRNYIFVIEILKDLYIGSILKQKKLKSFLDNTLENREYSNEELIQFYVDDYIHKKYFEYLQSMELKLRQDNLLQIKKKILIIFQTLLISKPEREEYILDLLIYKLGDPKVEISNLVISLLKNLQENHIIMSTVIIKRLHNYMKNSSITTEEGIYHTLILISQFKYFKNEEYLKYKFSIFFDYFNEYVEYDNQKYHKYLEVIIKILSSLLKERKNIEIDDLSKLVDEKMNLLFRLSHSSSIKLRIQVLKLIFTIIKDKDAKNKNKEINDNYNDYEDRYYKSLYELINLRDILVSKNIKELLKLIISSCLYDEDSLRCLAILRRLLQSATLAEPSFICCVLIIVSHVLFNKNHLWKYIDKIKKFNNNNNISIKRDPKYVDDSPLIEILYFLNHYHPTISKWAHFIIENYKTKTIEYNGDPILDFSLINFLNKFILKNPKIKNLKKKIEGSNATNKEDENLKFIEKFSKLQKTSKIKKKKILVDIEDYADKIVEDEIDKIDLKNDNLSLSEEDSIQ